MESPLEALLSEGPLLTDGAWGTQMQERGLPIGGCPDEWNLSHPEQVERVARSYVEAGSRIILTNTFGASRIALARHGLKAEAGPINRRGAEISRRAAGDDAWVFGSIGPTGRLLAMGDIDPGDLYAAFLEQATSLAEGGVGGLVIETMADLEEASIAARAALETGLPVVACMVFGAGRERDRTVMGVSPEAAVEALSAIGVSAVGANCGQGPAEMLAICRRLRAAASLPLWMKPNAGLPHWESGGAVTYDTEPAEFGRSAMALVEAGAAFVGGCCGTDPAYIRALAAALGRAAGGVPAGGPI